MLDLRGKNEAGEAWDGSLLEVRNRIRSNTRQRKPVAVIGCPTASIIEGCKGKEWNRTKAMVHQGFIAEVCREQHEAGRTFVHEFIEGSSSLEHPVFKEIRNKSGVKEVVVGTVELRGSKVESKVITNSASIAKELEKCPEGQDWDECVMRGIIEDMKSSGRVSGNYGECAMAIEQVEWEQYFDDLSGEHLNGDMVRVARGEEMREVKKHRVYDKGR